MSNAFVGNAGYLAAQEKILTDSMERLMYESGLTAQGCWDEMDDYDQQAIIRFARLIVKECLDIALEVRGEPATDTHYVIGYDRACEKMIDGIKEHFGVEE